MADRPVVSPVDQENTHPNVPPLADALSNVRDAARVARAAHIDWLAKETGKRKRGPRNSNAAKIEALLSHVDGAETAFQLAEDVVRYLSAIENAVAIAEPRCSGRHGRRQWPQRTGFACGRGGMCGWLYIAAHRRQSDRGRSRFGRALSGGSRFDRSLSLAGAGGAER